MAINIPYSTAGGGGLPQLAPDLTFPNDKYTFDRTDKQLSVSVTAGVLSTVLSLTGKWSISQIHIHGLVAEEMTYKLTIDGEVIWNAVGKSNIRERLLGTFAAGTTDPLRDEYIQCNASLLLQINTTSDTSVTLYYKARPIL